MDAGEVIAIAGGGILVNGGMVVGLVKWLAGRNVNSLDKTIESLGESIGEMQAAHTRATDTMKDAINALGNKVLTLEGLLNNELRTMAKEYGFLSGRLEKTEERVVKQAETHLAAVESFRRDVYTVNQKFDEVARRLEILERRKGGR